MNFLIRNQIAYNVALLFIIVASTIVNYEANMMPGLVVLYQDFSEYFKSGFNQELIFKHDQYTFPMWGYGIVLLLGKFKLVIIIFQQLLTFGTLLYILRISKNILLPKYFNQFKLLLLFSFPWFFFHTSLWPYSMCSNLLLIGMTTLILGVKENSKYKILISSICFGIILNCRSDYYYYVFFVTAILIILKFIYGLKFNGLTYINIFMWIVVINIFLIPWGIYSLNKTGSYLQTSTNAGHVFFIGLGQLPNNKWGITQEDNDSVMYSLINKEFKNKSANSLKFNENKFLTKQFVRFVKEDPYEYVKKCTFVFYRIIRTPFYTGSLEKKFASESKILIIKAKIKNMLDHFDFLSLIKYLLIGDGLVYFASGLVNLFSIFVFLSFIYFGAKSIKLISFKNYDIIIILIFALILYQLALSVFAFYMPIYNTNIYMFYLFSIFYCKTKLSNYSINKVAL